MPRVLKRLTHIDPRGQAQMVDVGDKAVSTRTALARAHVRMSRSTLRALRDQTTPKGDVLATARIAGIQAAKRTWELIPMCHQVQLTSVKVELTLVGTERVVVEARAEARDRTGVEMEALTAASVAALTVYDMLKALDRAIVVEEVQLVEKTGGKSGDFRRPPARVVGSKKGRSR